MWWALNSSFKHESVARLSGVYEEPKGDSRWDALIAVGKIFTVITAYLLILVTMLAVLEPQGLGWTLLTAGVGMAVGTGGLLLFRRAEQQGMVTVFGRNNDVPGT